MRRKVESTTKDDAKRRRLASLVKGIKDALAQLKGSIAAAIVVGERLITARELVEHGQWLPWLKEHFDLSPRSAQRFMRLASKKKELLAKCDSGVVFETIADALDALVPVTVQVIKETTEPRRINVEIEQISVPLMSPEAAAYYAEQHEQVSVPLMSPEAAASYAEQQNSPSR